jgi:thiol-disulfide isomerase/thioredoxin
MTTTHKSKLLVTMLYFILICCGCGDNSGSPSVSRVNIGAPAPKALSAPLHDLPQQQSSDTREVELLIFSAVWCEVCREIPPVVARLRQEYPSLEVTELDLDEGDNFDRMADYGGDAVPYMFVLVDGNVVRKIKGLLPFAELSKRIRLAYSTGDDKLPVPAQPEGDEIMEILPRHVICVLGQWHNFDQVKDAVAACGEDFTLDEEYSQLSPDARMTAAFEASVDRFHPSMTDDDWEAVRNHTAVAYILSPPIHADAAESISARALLLTATLLNQGGLAAKSESAGLAHGRSRWIELGRSYMEANTAGDPHSASATLYWAWVQRLLHDPADGLFYCCGMHLLGHRDTEIDDSLPVADALEWIDMMGLYLVADKPDRPVLAGEGFRLCDEGPRRIINFTACERYDDDGFFFNPYGYNRLVSEQRLLN